MTELLVQAIEAIKKLPDPEQDAIAAQLLEELADDRRWDEAFARSSGRLAEIAEQVRAEVRAGKAKPLVVDEL